MSKRPPTSATAEASTEKTQCGVIMPIAAIDGCSAAHWADVLAIIQESLEDTVFQAELVSSSNDTAIIHKTIVKNLYSNEIVVCDVSARNPNVMLELGMRLAFNKPVVVIKDDATPYSFDTSPILHLEYPRDLRFPSVKDFKVKLKQKVIATHEAAKAPGYSFFLAEYTIYESASLPKEEVAPYDMVLKELAEVKKLVTSSKAAESSSETASDQSFEGRFYTFSVPDFESLDKVVSFCSGQNVLVLVDRLPSPNGPGEVRVKLTKDVPLVRIYAGVQKILRRKDGKGD
ncbi:MAG: RNA helicase [Prosthecobacter sp.]